MNNKSSEISFQTVFSNSGVDVGILKWMYDLPQPMLLVNEQGNVLFINETASQLLLWQSEDIPTLPSIDPSLKSTKLISEIGENLGKKTVGQWIRKDESLFEAAYSLQVFQHEPLLVTVFFESVEHLASNTDVNDLGDNLLLHELMNCTSEAILIINATYEQIINCNNRAVELFESADKEAFLNLKSIDLYKYPMQKDDVARIHAHIEARGKWSAEMECRSQKGREFWCHMEIGLIKSNKDSYQYLVRLMDIDLKKKTEEHLKQSTKRYQDLVMYNQALICLHDMDGKILSINPASYKSLGYISDDELLGQNLKLLFDPKNIEGYHQYIKRIDQVGEASGVMQVIGKHKKRMFWLYHNYKVNETGSKPYVVGSAIDITDRIYAERELKKAKDFAEQSLKARELFLANVSHELRTPLHGILNINNFLANTPLNDEQKEFTQIINSSAENLLFLVNDILDVAKMESGKFELEEVPFNITEVLTKSIEPFVFSAQQKKISLHVSMPEKPIATLIGDAQRLSQVVLNLLSNAIKFTDEGQVDFQLEVLADSSRALIIAVKIIDSGIGIAEDKLQYIFQNYTQVHAARSRSYGGTGLGLSICRKLIEAQQGNIYCISTLGEGSEFGFIITYPKAQTGVIPQSKIQKEINYEAFKGLKALLVEDNSVNQLICKFLLNQKEITVEIADDGASALELASSQNYDFILMDIILPDIKGNEVAAIIRGLADKRKAEVPIIALTANAMKGDSENYIRAGMNGYLSKPYTEPELLIKISDVLGMSLEIKIEDDTSLSQEIYQIKEICDLSVLKTMLGDEKLIGDYIKNYCINTIVSEINALKKVCANRDVRNIPDILNNVKIILVEIYNETLNQIVSEVEIAVALGLEFSKLLPDIYKIIAFLEQIVVELKASYNISTANPVIY